MENIPTNSSPTPRIASRIDTVNLHSKQPSGIAVRLRKAGIDWVASFGQAIKRNDKQLLTLWVKILPYLVVTQGHRKIGRRKGRASKAALQALNELEQEGR